MNYNDILRTKLTKNIKISLILFIFTFLFFLWKLYQILFTDLLEVQYVLIMKDYFPIFFAIHGLLALLSSVIIKHKFDSLYPHHQLALFLLLGFLFFPFNAYLIYLGIEKYKEQHKYKKTLVLSILIGLTLIISLYTLSISQTKDIKPIYLNEYIIEGIYRLDDENFVTLTVTGLARGKELKNITYDAQFTFDAPDLSLVGTEFVQISMNVKQTCIVYAFTEAQENEEMTCTIDQFTEASNRLYTIDDFTQFEDLYVEIGQIDVDFVMSRTHAGAMTITNRTFKENVYDQYN